jgi:tetratricopeptide (TPR) repeat protein
LLVKNAADYRETRITYRRIVDHCGPDDFYTISRHARQDMATMTTVEILAYLRLSGHDSHLFAQYLPRLQELAPTMGQQERETVLALIERVWQGYFPLGEALDLAYEIACLLYALDDYAQALVYFERSVERYGAEPGTLYNMAICARLLGFSEQAREWLKMVIAQDSENHRARALFARYQKEDAER